MFDDITNILGEEYVLSVEQAALLYPCPSQSKTSIKGVFQPGSIDDVQAIVNWANEHKVALYPLSTGRNWGYGGGNPVEEDCVIVDLGRMCNISYLDAELGLVTVEPGVSQGMLYNYLNEQGADLYAPVTGSSPHCSLIGNAMERGYGVTPFTDHFYAVQSLTVVLPDGSLFKGLLSEFSNKSNNLGKWGAGPYIDGLFSQGNFGIVVEATFKLVHRASHHVIIMFEPKTESFGQVVDSTKKLLGTHGGVIQSVKFFNQYYSVALNEPYPTQDANQEGFSADEWVEKKAKELGFPEWIGMIFIGGSKSLVKATVADCKEGLSSGAKNVCVADDKFVRVLKHTLPLVPSFGRLHVLKVLASILVAGHILMKGKPQEKFLQAAYWRAGERPQEQGDWNPGRDGCGLIWFAPYLPFTGKDIKKFQDITEKTCAKFGVFPIFSMTTLSDQGVSALLPIMFDPKTELDKANACHKALFDACQSHGYLPYRAHLDSMTWFTQGRTDNFYEAVQKAKCGVDENYIISPGRYDGHIYKEVN